MADKKYWEKRAKELGIDSLFACPVCGSELEHERVDDGYIVNRIRPNGEVEETANKSNGYDIVRCSKDSKHEIEGKHQEFILDLVI